MNNKLKQYILKMIWSMEEDELIHLSEEFSDLETFTFDIGGRKVRPPQEMQKILNEIDQWILGLS